MLPLHKMASIPEQHLTYLQHYRWSLPILKYLSWYHQTQRKCLFVFSQLTGNTCWTSLSSPINHLRHVILNETLQPWPKQSFVKSAIECRPLGSKDRSACLIKRDKVLSRVADNPLVCHKSLSWRERLCLWSITHV